MSLTITPSPFGSLTVSVAETNSTLSVTTVATSPAVLSMALGVPGPTGATGSQGPAGADGQPGVGVPTGGSAGQALVKLSGSNYDTGWTSINSAAWGNITGTLSNQTDLYEALAGKLSLSGGTVIGTVNFGLNEQAIYCTISSSNFYYQPYSGGAQQGIFNINNDGTVTLADIDNNTLSISAGGITFADNTQQSTAFIPADYLTASNIASTYLTQSNASSTYYAIPTGTTSQYIRGDGSLYTFPAVGDRYLTSSTTSLTISNGAKTLTIGTGLSYSTQQDVTIAYDASNHMHATVTSYNSTTGVMVCDVYNKSGSGTYTAWTVNVGGVVGGSYLQTANNLSELTATASTARTNLGLGTMAVETASNYLAKADNLSGLASTSTARTNLGLTSLATASFATTSEAQAGTSTTTVVSPSTFFDARWFSGSKSMVQIAWSTSTSGTGASAGAQNSNARLNTAPTTATGYAIASAVIANNTRGTVFNSGFDFSKRIAIGLRVARNVASPDTNSVWRFSIGKNSVTDASDLAARGLMVKVAGNGALQLLVHNGTSLDTKTSTFTPANGVSYDIVVTSDGAGNVVLYVNGSSVATSTAGPTSAGTTNANIMMFEVQNTATISGSPQNICISDYFLQLNV